MKACPVKIKGEGGKKPVTTIKKWLYMRYGVLSEGDKLGTVCFPSSANKMYYFSSIIEHTITLMKMENILTENELLNSL